MSTVIEKIIPAQCRWVDEQPIASAFDDVYFSKHDGLAETRYIFLQQNQLPQRWQTQTTDFVIAETGFGTGLNFLAACQLWLESKSNNILHYISFDKHPLLATDLQRSLACWPALADLAQALHAHYPALISGWHRVVLFEQRVILNLYFGDVQAGLASQTFKADAWFLDGFAPRKNPAMWSPKLFAAIAAHSQPQASFATYTAASAVRKGLAEVGFAVKKINGYGRKRDACCGVYQNKVSHAPNTKTAPWFAHAPLLQPINPSAPLSIGIIGAGLAGAFTANVFARRGYQVTVYDQAETVAQGASGNHQAMVYCRFSAYASSQYSFYHQAYIYALQQLKSHASFQSSGLLDLRVDEKTAKRQDELQVADFWPPEYLQFVDASRASEIAGLPIAHNACYLPQGGYVNPVALCQALLRHQNIQLKTACAIDAIEYAEGQWQLYQQQRYLEAKPLLVLANADACLQFAECSTLSLKTIRGQVTHLPMTSQSQRLNVPICFERYIAPAQAGIHSLGASFNLYDNETQARHADNEMNIVKLQATLPDIAQQLTVNGAQQYASRVGFRCYAPDYLPVVGPLPDTTYFASHYTDLHQGKLAKVYPPAQFYPGLFVNVAHGARGVVSAPLAAEVLFQYVHPHGMFPLSESVRQALHPARFLVKKLSRKNH